MHVKESVLRKPQVDRYRGLSDDVARCAALLRIHGVPLSLADEFEEILSVPHAGTDRNSECRGVPGRRDPGRRAYLQILMLGGYEGSSRGESGKELAFCKQEGSKCKPLFPNSRRPFALETVMAWETWFEGLPLRPGPDGKVAEQFDMSLQARAAVMLGALGDLAITSLRLDVAQREELDNWTIGAETRLQELFKRIRRQEHKQVALRDRSGMRLRELDAPEQRLQWAYVEAGLNSPGTPLAEMLLLAFFDHAFHAAAGLPQPELDKLNNIPSCTDFYSVVEDLLGTPCRIGGLAELAARIRRQLRKAPRHCGSHNAELKQALVQIRKKAPPMFDTYRGYAQPRIALVLRHINDQAVRGLLANTDVLARRIARQLLDPLALRHDDSDDDVTGFRWRQLTYAESRTRTRNSALGNEASEAYAPEDLDPQTAGELELRRRRVAAHYSQLCKRIGPGDTAPRRVERLVRHAFNAAPAAATVQGCGMCLLGPHAPRVTLATNTGRK